MATTKEQTPEQRAHAERLKLARALAKGITDEAMEILRAHAETKEPAFIDCERLADGTPVPMDAGVLSLRAASRDGEGKFFRWIERMRADGLRSLKKAK